MNTRFFNGRVLPMAGNLDVISEGEVWVKGNEILYAGPREEVPEKAPAWDREIDLKGDLVMPGFKDAHTHSGMSFLRSAADDMELSDWLNQQIFPREALLTPEEIYIASKLSILEYLTSGITAICEMYLTPYSIARATEECGIRCVQCSCMNAYNHSIREQEEWFDRLNHGNPLTSYHLGIHAEYTCSRELLEEAAALANRLKTPVYLHNSETKAEVEGCKERYGMTPTAFFDSLGMFEYGGTCFHAVHVTEDDIRIMRERGLSVVTNPASNAKLASGIAPITAYMEAGINVGIGTDSAASNNCLDMFREMFLVTALAKLREENAAAVDAGEVLRMAVARGAHAMGLTDCDMLAPGKKADLIVIDMHQPNMQPVNNIPKNLVYSGSKQNVRLTMVDGKVLYEEGKFFIGAEPADIYRDVQKIIDRM